MSRKANQLVTAGCAVVLLAAAGIQGEKLTKAAYANDAFHLKAVLPHEIVGWQARELRLGPTESANESAEKTLRFDEVFYREFQSPKSTVSVYAAYWGPGKMPVQLVASHTPDRCWVENGWKNEAVKHDVRLITRGTHLREGEWRIFLAPDHQELHVQFWHLIGSDSYDYGDRVSEVPSIWRWWRDAAKQIFKTPSEQYFVRLTSTRPFEELAGDPGWEELISALANIGLEANDKG